MNKERLLKEVTINGIKVKIELTREEFDKFPKKLESTIRVKDKFIDN